MTTIALKSCTTSWPLSGFADEAGEASDVQITVIKRAGFRHIDLRGIDGHNISQLPLNKAEDIQRKLAAANISVAMFGSPIGKIDITDDMQMDLAKLTHLGKLSEIFSCKAVRIFSYFNKTNRPLAEWQSESLTRLKMLRELAEELGLVLYHENESHIFGDTSKNVRVIAREIRGDAKPGEAGAFRMIFDFDNFNRTGKDAWTIWQELRDYTDAFHLKDSDVSGQHVPVGAGVGRVREILADALSRQWHGPLSLEPHLQHSAAVIATGPSGQANRKYSEMTPADVWNLAAEAAKLILGQIKAPVV
ncbi:MAG: TIM barrel protein [Phycisphaeraceae bacterium]|nr:TIM barrel protein [Phycisphaeraceae bacterium]